MIEGKAVNPVLCQDAVDELRGKEELADPRSRAEG
jgi:hypothetical protein